MDDAAGLTLNPNPKPEPVRPAWWRTSAGAPVLEACLRETLRLHPVAPFVARKLTSGVSVSPEGGESGVGALTLPAGCAAGVWLHAVHRDPAVWVDPDSFDPSRWLVRSDSIRSNIQGWNRTPGDVRVKFKGAGFMPFATGPRSCVGQHLAWVYMRVVLAGLVRAYEVRLAEGEGEGDALTPSVGFTVTPANAARVRLVPTGE